MCLGKSGEVYNIGNTNPEISVKEVIKILNKVYKKKIQSKQIVYPKSYPDDEPLRRCPDISKAKKHLNYKPQISIEKGLKNYLMWATRNYKY